jgi:hypothetical protein
MTFAELVRSCSRNISPRMLSRVRSSRGRPINAPAVFIHPCQPVVATQPPTGPGWASGLFGLAKILLLRRTFPKILLLRRTFCDSSARCHCSNRGRDLAEHNTCAISRQHCRPTSSGSDSGRLANRRRFGDGACIGTVARTRESFWC